MRLQAVLDCLTRDIPFGRELLEQSGQPSRVCGIGAAAPHMAKQGFTDISVGQALRVTGHRQPQQGQRIEGVGCRQLQLDVVLLCLPQHLPVGPVTFSRHLRRAQLPVVLEQRAKQHRLVDDLVAQPKQGLRQMFKRQISIGRDRIKVKGDLLHAVLPWIRCSILLQIWRFAAVSDLLHWQISSRVRKQPWHRLPCGSMRHTEMQGEVTYRPPALT